VDGKIKLFNEFCAIDQPDDECITRYKVHYSSRAKYTPV